MKQIIAALLAIFMASTTELKATPTDIDIPLTIDLTLSNVAGEQDTSFEGAPFLRIDALHYGVFKFGGNIAQLIGPNKVITSVTFEWFNRLPIDPALVQQDAAHQYLVSGGQIDGKSTWSLYDASPEKPQVNVFALDGQGYKYADTNPLTYGLVEDLTSWYDGTNPIQTLRVVAEGNSGGQAQPYTQEHNGGDYARLTVTVDDAAVVPESGASGLLLAGGFILLTCHRYASRRIAQLSAAA